MQVQNDAQPYDTINITPMLDLAYVLLVIFILMTTAGVQGLKMNLPKPSNKPSTEKHDVKIVQVQQGGGVLINGVGVSAAELEGQLNSAKAADPKFSVMIKGDASAHYDKVSEVLEICKKLDITEVGLVTKKLAE